MARKKPTKRQKAMVKIIKKNLRKNNSRATLKKMALEAKYSKSVAKHPDNITESLGFQDLLAKELPEKEVLKTHRGLLESHKVEYLSFPIKENTNRIKGIIKKAGFKFLSISEIKVLNKKFAYFLIPENKSRANAVDMFYKLKGSYASDKIEDQKYGNLSDEELDEMLEEGEEVELRFKKYKRIVKTKPTSSPQSPPSETEQG